MGTKGCLSSFEISASNVSLVKVQEAAQSTTMPRLLAVHYASGKSACGRSP